MRHAWRQRKLTANGRLAMSAIPAKRRAEASMAEVPDERIVEEQAAEEHAAEEPPRRWALQRIGGGAH